MLNETTWANVCFRPKAAIGNQLALALTARTARRKYYVMRSKGSKNLISGHFSDPPLLVLTSLAAGPKHGHAILNDIEAMCGTRLGPGTLYGAISRLEEDGLIEPLPAIARRRPYQLTSAGAAAFAAKMATLQRFVATGAKRLATV